MENENIYQRPACMTGTPYSFWPVRELEPLFRSLGEVIDELKIREKTIGVVGVGSSSFMPEFFNFDFLDAATGKAPSVAQGLKCVQPDRVIFTFQSFNDLCFQGFNDLFHRVRENTPITALFLNNGLNPQISEFYHSHNPEEHPSSPNESSKKSNPNPEFKHGFKIAEMVAHTSLLSKIPTFVARAPIFQGMDPTALKSLLKKGLLNQIKKGGFSLIELMSPGVSFKNLTPAQAHKKYQKSIEPVFPSGILLDVKNVK